MFRVLTHGKLIGAGKTSFLAQSSQVRAMAEWNKDWLPGDYPRNEEQKIESAKRYNMHPADYVPHDEDAGLADYPKLEKKSYYQRDPFEYYDFPEHRRNLAEPVYFEFEKTLADKFDPDTVPDGTLMKRTAQLTLFLVFMTVGNLLFEFYGPQQKTLPREMYVKGEKHYVFEHLPPK